MKNSIVWLTGASSGIGEALAFELADRGAQLILTARRAEVLERVASEIQSRGGTAWSFPGDVTDGEALRKLVAAAEKQCGPIDIVIANAGNHIPSLPERFDGAEYLDLMRINFGGMIHTIEAVIPHFLDRGRGHIVGVSSLSGLRGLPTAAAYGASKAAMINFLESSRFHLQPLGIDVTIVNPGFVKTPLTDKNKFPMPFRIDALKAARIICRGIEREAKVISFPIPFNWFIEASRFIPTGTFHWLVSTFVWKKVKENYL